MARRRGSRTSLISQILTDGPTSLGASGITSSKFTEVDHRSSTIVLKKCESHLNSMPGQASLSSRARLCVISKPRSEGVPVFADEDDERYVVHTSCSFASRITTENALATAPAHDMHKMKIVVPLVNDLYASVFNDDAVAATFSFFLRLFWQLI